MQKSDGLTTSWGDLETSERGFLQLFIHTLARGYEIREHQAAKSHADQFRLTLKWLTYILVGMLSGDKRKRRFRDPERTRERLLQAAFREIHRSGFQSAGINTILAATNVTKGALYHHFDSKEALGYAIVDEIIAKLVRDRWLRPLLTEGQPIDILIGIVRRLPVGPADVRESCPLLNLAQEMSPLDEQFRTRLERLFLAWQEGVATLLRRGQSQGTVRRDLNADETASFLVAMVEGHAVLAKNAQDPKVWRVGIRNIVGWLTSLRAPRRSGRSRRRILKKHGLRQRRRL